MHLAPAVVDVGDLPGLPTNVVWGVGHLWLTEDAN